jgi:hypothetical protein
MQKEKTKKIATFTLLTLLIVSMAGFASITTIQALDIPTYIKIHVEPDPVGIGQDVYISAFMTKPTATAGMGSTGDLYTGITIEITDPDGQKTNLGPYTADATGGVGGLSFTPNKLGNYTLKAFYPGQNLTRSASSIFGPGTDYSYVRELPSESDPETLTVQQEQIPQFPIQPLPTEYWSRPINAQNYAWATLAGSWYGLAVPAFATTGMYDATGNFNPYSSAPNTAHIVWNKPTAFGGQVGGPIPADQESQFTSTSILINYFEPIILDGVLYYGEMAGINSQVVSWNAVDLRTGQTLWTSQPGVTASATAVSFEKLRMGQNLRFHSMQEYGSTSFLYSIVGGGMFGGAATYRLYEPTTGAYMGVIYNVTTDMAYFMDTDPTHENVGTLFGYFTSGGNLSCWNSTLCMGNGNAASEILRPPTVMNFSKGIQWTVKLPVTLADNRISLSIAARTPDVILLRQAPNLVTQTSAGYAIDCGFNAHTGELLWGPKNQSLPLYGDMSLLSAKEGVYVLHNKDTHELYGYSLNTGDKLWGPTKLPGTSLSTLTVAGDIAYGNVYVWDFGGYVSAVNINTGVINWTYVPRSAGYNTPYGVYPIWVFGSQSIADGKIFLSESHMYNPPLFPGAQRLALNCTDGSLVWSINSFSGRCPGAIADGFLVEWNSYDNQIYTFGKGQTAITASLANDVVTEGNNVLITGMVTDESPGTKNADRIARFPNGVPAVSDESMTPFMEYVYMQQPKPTNTTGVPVAFSVLDSNNNYRQIGSTTTDANGYYSFKWTPDITGTFAVYANFAGSESYWPASTETFFTVDSAAPTPSPIPIAVAPPTEMYILAGVAAIIIAIAIVGAVLALMIRKRP